MNPDQMRKLRGNPSLVSSAPSEIIRYQAPLSHMCRNSLVDTTLGNKKIKRVTKSSCGTSPETAMTK